MQIIYDVKFINSFINIWDYIAENSKNRADKFKKELKRNIENLSLMPYKCRKSIYFDDEHIRDLIFKGYTIACKIDKTKKSIVIIGIKKYKSAF